MLNALLAASCLLLSVPQTSILDPYHYRESYSTSDEVRKPELNLFYSPSCPYSRKVLNYLDHVQKKIPMTDVQNNPDAKEYLKTYGGIMQVPCLCIDGQPLYEADDIIEWLSQHLDLLESTPQPSVGHT